jgi:hypothetical protein
MAHECTRCRKTLTTLKRLENHLRRHEPRTCQVCHRKFSSSSNLSRHKRGISTPMDVGAAILDALPSKWYTGDFFDPRGEAGTDLQHRIEDNGGSYVSNDTVGHATHNIHNFRHLMEITKSPRRVISARLEPTEIMRLTRSQVVLVVAWVKESALLRNIIKGETRRYETPGGIWFIFEKD